eukprot:1184404-Prorocentrum_minimum.AAC.7
MPRAGVLLEAERRQAGGGGADAPRRGHPVCGDGLHPLPVRHLARRRQRGELPPAGPTGRRTGRLPASAAHGRGLLQSAGGHGGWPARARASDRREGALPRKRHPKKHDGRSEFSSDKMDLSYPCIVVAEASQLKLGRISPKVGWVDATNTAGTEAPEAAAA